MHVLIKGVLYGGLNSHIAVGLETSYTEEDVVPKMNVLFLINDLHYNL